MSLSCWFRFSSQKYLWMTRFFTQRNIAWGWLFTTAQFRYKKSLSSDWFCLFITQLADKHKHYNIFFTRAILIKLEVRNLSCLIWWTSKQAVLVRSTMYTCEHFNNYDALSIWFIYCNIIIVLLVLFWCIHCSISKRYDSLKATFWLDPLTLCTFLELCSSHELLTLCGQLPPFIVLLQLKKIVSCTGKLKKDEVSVTYFLIQLCMLVKSLIMYWMHAWLYVYNLF